VGDDLPGGQVRGWADRVAEGLAAAHPEEPTYYANLAIRGRKIAPIVEDQLPRALALEPSPTLLSFNGGGNDMMRFDFDLDRVMALTERVIEDCATAGVHLLMLSGPDPSDHLPRSARLHTRSVAMTEVFEERFMGREGITYVNNFDDLEARRDVYWSPDRLHMNAYGHARVAARILTALGVPTPMPDVSRAPGRERGVTHEARYWREHLAPWAWRRLRGKSSGDGRVAKHPEWVLRDPDGF
jgi:lysophospholipase L1-like esterase